MRDNATKPLSPRTSREVTGGGTARFRVVLENGTTLVVSRSRAPQLKHWMI